MLLVSTQRLKTGMVTATTVLHPQSSATKLIQPKIELTVATIKRLKELGVPHVWIRHPLLHDLDRIILSKVPEHRKRIYETIKTGFDDLQTRVISSKDYQHYAKAVAGLIEELIGRDGRAGELAERLFNDGDEMASHCANVAYLSISVAMHLEYYITRERGRISPREARDLTSLGVGAMLHDIGKFQIEPVHRSLHQTSERQSEDYLRHVIDGFEMMRHRINPVASTIALHHHQRWDGAGWPDMTALTHGRYKGGLRGSKIHIFARIVAVTNALDALMCPSPGQSMPTIYAMHELQSKRFDGAFDPLVLDAFLRYVPPFPVGTEVVLNNGYSAAVTGLNPDRPCRPNIRLIDERSSGQDIDLAETPELRVAESQGHDVRPWHYTLRPKLEVLTLSNQAG